MIQFRPDPPPSGMDPLVAEWVQRQLLLLSQSTDVTAEIIAEGEFDATALSAKVTAVENNLNAHVQNSTTAHQLDDIKTSLLAHENNTTNAHGIGVVKTDLATHVASQTAHGVENKMAWAGVWSAGTYQKNALVNDVEYLFVALTNTTAKPLEAPTWTLPTSPGWVNSSMAGPLTVGARYTLMADSVLEKLRGWAYGPVTLSYVIDPLGTPKRHDLSIDGSDWVESDILDQVLRAGTVIDVFMELLGGTVQQDEIVNGWATPQGIKTAGLYDPNVTLTRNQYGVDIRLAKTSVDWELLK